MHVPFDALLTDEFRPLLTIGDGRKEVGVRVATATSIAAERRRLLEDIDGRLLKGEKKKERKGQRENYTRETPL